LLYDRWQPVTGPCGKNVCEQGREPSDRVAIDVVPDRQDLVSAFRVTQRREQTYDDSTTTATTHDDSNDLRGWRASAILSVPTWVAGFQTFLSAAFQRSVTHSTRAGTMARGP
jgi:hypothetical protein